MTPIWHTARDKFNSIHPSQDGWKRYVEWARMPQLLEVVGLDCNLNGLSFEYDAKEADVYHYLITDDGRATDLFNSAPYVLQHTNSMSSFNFMAVAKNPSTDCSERNIEGFLFLGYELLDAHYDISALTNCGGFDETFLPSELNEFGLITDYERALEIREQLLVNNPGEGHADCNLMGIWRHKTIGFYLNLVCPALC